MQVSTVKVNKNNARKMMILPHKGSSPKMSWVIRVQRDDAVADSAR